MDHIQRLRDLKQAADEKGIPELMTWGERAMLELAARLDKLEAASKPAMTEIPSVSPYTSRFKYLEIICQHDSPTA